MTDSRIVEGTELILRGRVARRPVTLVGTMEDGVLTQISGCVTLNASLFDLLGDLGADYGEAAGVLGQLAGSPQGADIVLEKLGAAYRKGAASTVQVGLLIQFGGAHCQFALLKRLGDKGGFVVGVDLRSDRLTLPRNFLSGLIGDLCIGNLGVYYATERFEDAPFFSGDGFQDATLPAPMASRATGRHFPKGVSVSAEIRVGGVNLLDQLRAPQAASQVAEEAEDTPKDGAAAAEKAEEALAKGSTHWIDTNKLIGPLNVRRVGLSYEAPRIGIRLDAGLRLSVLSLSLQGLGLSYPINQFRSRPKEIWENLQFHLDGASIALVKGPLLISGGLIKTRDEPLQLDGVLLVQTSIFTISALGSYANLNGAPSLFIFAALQKELGGPAFFFVMGLAGGFGVNRVLKLPTINEVHHFPLIRAATDPTYLGADLDLSKVSRKLDEYIYPSQGSYWVAAGVKFTSFGQIDSFALLSISFGTQLEIALLGISTLRVPKPLPGGDESFAIAFAELAFKVVIAPSNGLLGFEARLTENSHVLRKDFKLRGGFAFYAWFGGEHQGDFVVSIGGYHPRFKPPAHYPKPDLVEFSCKVGETVAIRGFCYFALCPSAIMAGGGLSIVFQLGGIRAWFVAQADFLVQWKPLFYDVAIGVSIGVALRLRIGVIRINLSVELSASVALHGPPLGGKARVSLYVVTIEIAFGTAKRTPPPLLWESDSPEKSFARAFLPNPKVATVTVTEGLIKESRVGEQTVSVVSPQKLVLRALTLVPATVARFNDSEFSAFPQPTIKGRPTTLGVRPMNRSSLHSALEVTLEPDGNTSASPDARAYLQRYLSFSIVTTSVPLALWGNDPLDRRRPPDDQMIDGALVGIEIRTRPGPRPWETPVFDLRVLACDRFSREFDWITARPGAALPAFGDKTLGNTVMAREVKARRAGILHHLAATGRNIMKPEDVALEHLAENAEYLFQDMPAMARAGQYPPRGYLET
jgi:hypothetical protein